MSDQILMSKGFSDSKMRGVVCPDCGTGGGNRYPCWCHNCGEKGDKVLMLPSINRFTYVTNWSESVK